MISKKLLTGLLAAACSVGMLVATTASAQYVGPTRVTAKTSIRSVLKTRWMTNWSFSRAA